MKLRRVKMTRPSAQTNVAMVVESYKSYSHAAVIDATETSPRPAPRRKTKQKAFPKILNLAQLFELTQVRSLEMLFFVKKSDPLLRILTLFLFFFSIAILRRSASKTPPLTQVLNPM
jgi:hypothetical protein